MKHFQIKDTYININSSLVDALKFKPVVLGFSKAGVTYFKETLVTKGFLRFKAQISEVFERLAFTE